MVNVKHMTDQEMIQEMKDNNHYIEDSDGILKLMRVSETDASWKCLNTFTNIVDAYEYYLVLKVFGHPAATEAAH